MQRLRANSTAAMPIYSVVTMPTLVMLPMAPISGITCVLAATRRTRATADVQPIDGCHMDGVSQLSASWIVHHAMGVET